MPPKKGNAPSKKTEQKQKQKVFEDKTFGLKNKNKSNKVQKEIQSMKKVIMGGNQRKKEIDPNEEKKQRRLEDQQRIKELQSIFKPVKAKEPVNAEGTSNNASSEMSEEEKAAALAALDEDVTLSIEDLIEKERALIIDGTPVTAETFAMWKKLKKEQKERREKEKEEQQIEKFKKSGSGITGRALFGYDSTLFVDDADAADKDAYIITEDLADILGEVDDSLFSEEISSGSSNFRVYDPDTWKEDKTPKQQLFEYLTSQKVEDMPKFEKLDGDFYKIILTHLDNKELTTTVPYTSKKNGEHGASLIALDYLKNPQAFENKGEDGNNDENENNGDDDNNDDENNEEGDDDNDNEDEDEGNEN